MNDRKEYFKAWYLKNKEKRIRQNKLWQQANQVSRSAYIKKWKQEHPEETKQVSTNYSHSFQGHITRMWNSMNNRLRKRKSYIGKELEFDKKWFVDFASQSDKLRWLYTQWMKHDYVYHLVPTVDRKDSKLGYLKSNIQFLSHQDNSRKPRIRTKSILKTTQE